MKTTLFCIFLLLALFSITDAARGLRRLQEVKATKAGAGGATTNSVAGPQNCHYYWDCYWTNIPGIGEEEICNQVQICN